MTISMPSGTLPDNVRTRFRIQHTLETIYIKQHGKIYYAVFGWRKHIHGLKGGSLMMWSLLYCLLTDTDNRSWRIVITTMNELVQLSASCLLFSRHDKGLMTVSACCWLNLAQEKAWQVKQNRQKLQPWFWCLHPFRKTKTGRHPDWPKILTVCLQDLAIPPGYVTPHFSNRSMALQDLFLELQQKPNASVFMHHHS